MTIFNPDIHHRLSIRLKDFDYSRRGAYFITLCTQERLCLFGDVIDGEMVLNDAGVMIDRTWAELPEKYIGIQTEAFVIMPNHIHGVIMIGIESSVGAAPRGRPLSTSKQNGIRTATKFDLCENGQPQGVAPTNERQMSLYDIVHREENPNNTRNT